jgi:hypothetical protein
MENDLLGALQYYQAGKLEEARMIYQSLVRADQDSADALNLLGVLTPIRRVWSDILCGNEAA